MVAGARVGDEGERDDGAVVEPADARASRRPRPRRAARSSRGTSGLRPPRSRARRPSRAGVVRRRRRARRRTAAPSASVPREASAKCSRKCSGVKCESAPSRTSTRVTRRAPSERPSRSISRDEVLHQRALVHPASSQQLSATSGSTAAAHRRAEPVAGAERRALDPVHEQPRRAAGRARAPSSIASPTPNACVERAEDASRERARRSRRSGARVPGSAPDETASTTSARSAPSQASSSRLGSCSQHDHVDARRHALANALGDREADARRRRGRRCRPR